MGRRFRHHVNPLTQTYLQARATPLRIPGGPGAFERIEVELGCAEGQFSFALARARPSSLVVGLDIRERVIEDNRLRAREAGLSNLTFAYVNLNVDLDRIFASATVDRFHLLFPDPWFKSKHRKRRVMDPRLAAVLTRQLRPGGELHAASDVFDLALDVMAELDGSTGARLGFRNTEGPWTFARRNPLGIRTRREDRTLERGQRVWRVRYRLETGGGGRASGSAAQRA